MKHRCEGEGEKNHTSGVCLLGLGFQQQAFRNNSSCKVLKKLGTLIFVVFQASGNTGGNKEKHHSLVERVKVKTGRVSAE